MKKYEVAEKITGKELGISEKNIEIYVKYLQSCIIKSQDTINTTYKTYFDNMKLFFRYLKEHEGNRYILSADTQKNFTDIWERYCSYCFSQGNSRVTVNKKRTACSTFFDWCLKRRLIKVNPFIYVEKLKITAGDKRRNSYFLTASQIWEINYVMKKDVKHFDIQDRLLFNLFLDSGARISEIYNLKLQQLDLDEMLFNNVRHKEGYIEPVMDRLLFNLFLDSGARISEIYNLKLQQLDLDEMLFNNVRHKEGYIEPVIFFDDTKLLIKQWLRERQERGIESEFLFVTLYNKQINHMSKETIRSRIRNIGKIVGILDFYPHSIRKSILNITGQQSETVAAALGHHKNAAVTREHYMKKKKITEMRNTLLQIRSLAGL